jgi:hypothetical protein
VEAFLGKALRDQDSALLIDSQKKAVQTYAPSAEKGLRTLTLKPCTLRSRRPPHRTGRVPDPEDGFQTASLTNLRFEFNFESACLGDPNNLTDEAFVNNPRIATGSVLNVVGTGDHVRHLNTPNEQEKKRQSPQVAPPSV